MKSKAAQLFLVLPGLGGIVEGHAQEPWGNLQNKALVEQRARDLSLQLAIPGAPLAQFGDVMNLKRLGDQSLVNPGLQQVHFLIYQSNSWSIASSAKKGVAPLGSDEWIDLKKFLLATKVDWNRPLVRWYPKFAVGICRIEDPSSNQSWAIVVIDPNPTR